MHCSHSTLPVSATGTVTGATGIAIGGGRVDPGSIAGGVGLIVITTAGADGLGSGSCGMITAGGFKRIKTQVYKTIGGKFNFLAQHVLNNNVKNIALPINSTHFLVASRLFHHRNTCTVAKTLH